MNSVTSVDSVDVIDIDRDGNLDIITANADRSEGSLHLGLGDGTFQAPVALDVVNSGIGYVEADLDGDGDHEGIYIAPHSGQMYVDNGDPLPTLVGRSRSANERQNLGAQVGLAIVDVDADGTKDVLSTTQTGAVSTLVLNQEGDADLQDLNASVSLTITPRATNLVQPVSTTRDSLELSLPPSQMLLIAPGN